MHNDMSGLSLPPERRSSQSVATACYAASAVGLTQGGAA